MNVLKIVKGLFIKADMPGHSVEGEVIDDHTSAAYRTVRVPVGKNLTKYEVVHKTEIKQVKVNGKWEEVDN